MASDDGVRALPLLRLEGVAGGGERLVVSQQGCASISSDDQTTHSMTPLSVVAVLGVGKKGKSFLSNYLAGRDVFTVSGNIEACTSGVDITSGTLTLSQFAAISPAADVTHDGAAAATGSAGSACRHCSGEDCGCGRPGALVTHQSVLLSSTAARCMPVSTCHHNEQSLRGSC
jgi:Guanylate-binding protein, N-terminal domain